MSDLPAGLLDILACPCPRHAPVQSTEQGDALRCVRCRTTFPVRDGIPVMLLSEAQPGPNGVGGEA